MLTKLRKKHLPFLREVLSITSVTTGVCSAPLSQSDWALPPLHTLGYHHLVPPYASPPQSGILKLPIIEILVLSQNLITNNEK